tara:strand:+ start:188 stop:1096 length:909 start_codon:yes stop_codon:yes gene_type:complete
MSAIKTPEMQSFINTFGGMVPAGEEPDDALIDIFEDFGSPEAMFAWLAERWITGGFDKPGTKTTKETKTKKDPNKPKWCNAYMHFAKDQRTTVKEENPDMTNTEVTKELGRMWREDMSGEDKRPYQEASDEEKAACAEAMASYTAPASDGDGETSNPKKIRKKRAEGEPKKNLNAYMHFTMDQRTTVKEDNPDMTNTEVTKELGRMWREDMSGEDKEPYIEAAANDKQRYHREMENFSPSEESENPQPVPKTKKTPVKKEAAKKTPAKKEVAKKTPVKKEAAKKTPVKKDAAKKTPVKKAPK